ncbi:MAG: TolC family protein, partial [Gemmatimonadota bacterium]
MRPFAGIRPPLAATLLVLLATTAPSVAPPVAAQDPPSVPGRLTLEEALEIARQRNPALRRARNQVRSAAAGERQRWGQYLPSLSTSFSLSGNTSRRVTGEDDFGLPVSLDDPLEFEGSSTSQSMTLSYTLFDGFARENGLDQARAASRVATAGVEAERVRVEAEIRSAFYDALGAQRFIELERRLLASAEQRLETQRERLRVAAVDPEDVLGAEVDLANQQLAVERAVADARSFSLTLRETMGVDEDIEFEAVGGLPPLFDPSTLDADSLVGVALRTNPGVVQAAASVEEARHGVDIARGARWPTLSIGASVSRGMSLSSYELL